MPIDFPSSPATNDTYTFGSRVWTFNGDAWEFTGQNYTATFNNANFVAVTESVNIVASAATGTINVDVITASNWYYTSNASANFTLNIRGDSSTTLASILNVGENLVVNFLNTNGTTAYYTGGASNLLQIDGTSTGVTMKWQGGSVPTYGYASAVDIYGFNIIRTGTSTYTVFASQGKYA